MEATMESIELRPAIKWPDRYLPGKSDNFVSNEVFVDDLTAEAVWPQLIDTDIWASYYDGITDITFPDDDGPELRMGTRFNFSAFGYPPTVSQVSELVTPAVMVPGRLSWIRHGV